MPGILPDNIGSRAQLLDLLSGVQSRQPSYGLLDGVQGRQDVVPGLARLPQPGVAASMTPQGALMGLGQMFAPSLTRWATSDAPPPSYAPNTVGKIPPLGYHPDAQGAGEDAYRMFDFASSLPMPSKFMAMAAAPMAAKVAKTFARSAPEAVEHAAVELGGRLFTGPNHAVAIRNAEMAFGKPFEELIETNRLFGEDALKYAAENGLNLNSAHELGLSTGEARGLMRRENSSSIWIDADPRVDGFITSTGRFISREEAIVMMSGK